MKVARPAGGAGGNDLDALLRREFAEAAARHEEGCPGPEVILALHALDRRMEKVGAWTLAADWSAALVLGALATLLAFGWADARGPLDSALQLEARGLGWVADLALVGSLAAVALPWAAVRQRSA